ncbi:hypothetical protein QQP08_024178 [Theobroma cacao]|nr:hypothetical protein QQP08_024178 [Theobroma cacao]
MKMQMRVSRTVRVGPCRFENLLFWSPTGYQGRRFLGQKRKKGRRGLGHAMEGSVPGQKVCLNMNKETKLGKGRENG